MAIDRTFENRYQVIQYISIVVEDQSPDAALAEVEVLTVGDNISIGTAERGTFLNGTVAAAPNNLFDADINPPTSSPLGAATKAGRRRDLVLRRFRSRVLRR